MLKKGKHHHVRHPVPTEKSTTKEFERMRRENIESDLTVGSFNVVFHLLEERKREKERERERERKRERERERERRQQPACP